MRESCVAEGGLCPGQARRAPA